MSLSHDWVSRHAEHKESRSTDHVSRARLNKAEAMPIITILWRTLNVGLKTSIVLTPKKKHGELPRSEKKRPGHAGAAGAAV